VKDFALAYSGWNFLKTPSEQLCWAVGVADSMVFVKEEPEEGGLFGLRLLKFWFFFLTFWSLPLTIKL
jgi:hypothetical protein